MADDIFLIDDLEAGLIVNIPVERLRKISGLSGNSSIPSVLIFRGSVLTISDLESVSNPVQGDVYSVVEDNGLYVYINDYNGIPGNSQWVSTGITIDLTNYATIQFVTNGFVSKASNPDSKYLIYGLNPSGSTITYTFPTTTIDGIVGINANSNDFVQRAFDKTMLSTFDNSIPSSKAVKDYVDNHTVDLTGYATENWVNSQNFVTTSALNTYGFTTESWVQSYTSALYATITNVNSRELSSNKTTTWNTTTNNTRYPSEKLVKDSLDNKVDKVLGGSGLAKINTDGTITIATVATTPPTRVYGQDTSGNLTSNSVVQYKVASLQTTPLTTAELGSSDYAGVDRIDCPNMVPPRVYFLVGASWCYVELTNVV